MRRRRLGGVDLGGCDQVRFRTAKATVASGATLHLNAEGRIASKKKMAWVWKSCLLNCEVPLCAAPWGWQHASRCVARRVF